MGIKAQQMYAGVLRALWVHQRGSCAICGKPFWPRKTVRVDHDHVTGLVRGLLCDHCNLTEPRTFTPVVIAYRMNPPAAQLGLLVTYHGQHWRGGAA
jgi:hypothetical protein